MVWRDVHVAVTSKKVWENGGEWYVYPRRAIPLSSVMLSYVVIATAAHFQAQNGANPKSAEIFGFEIWK
jgi:hypothetical protein